MLVSADRNISRFANSNLHQNMSEESAELTLRVIAGRAMGVASTTVFDDESIAATAQLARDAARHARPLPNFSGLYRENEAAPALRTFDERALISPEAKARALREMFDRGAAHQVQFAGSYTTGIVSVACGNTHGVRRFCRATSNDATVIGLHAAGSGYATTCSRSSIDLAALGDEAVEKATLRGGKNEDLQPAAYDVILESPAIAEVLDWVNMISLSGQSFEDGSSFFVGNIGRRILSERFTLTDDSIDEQFLPFPFDMEGLPRRLITLIEAGVPRTPVVDKAYADRLSLPATANAWHLGSSDHGSAFHLAIAAGDASREELIASTKLGIWVTRFNYVNGLLEPRSALMTGTTRDGTFLIRDGEVTARLPNLRWTQSIVEGFSNIEGITRERRRVSAWYNTFGGTFAPAMKIRGWHFTGKT
ncbi:MAG TPA: TldD/PmbA family protein [Thermoanaerobaculia bacterium]